MKSYMILKVHRVLSATVCTLLLLSIHRVSSFLIPNVIEGRHGDVLNNIHIPSFPRIKKSILKDFVLEIKNVNEREKFSCSYKRSSSSDENVPNTKSIFQKIKLLSVLVVPSSVTELIKKRSLILITSFILFSVALFSNHGRSVLYPGSSKDKSFSEPLPPGKLGGCPLMGELSGFTNLNRFMSKLSKKFGNPRIWKMYFFGRPSAVLSGSEAINAMLDREFLSSNGVVSQVTSFGDGSELIFGQSSMSSVLTDKKEYHFQRRLVGSALKPQALANAVPFLQKGAEKSADRILSSAANNIKVNEICKDFTFDVAWRQIIGLKLNDDEMIEFHQAVSDWLSLFSSYFMLFLPKFILKRTKGCKAKKYIDSVIESKIDYLEKNGPDESTLSSMLFNVDEEVDHEGHPKRHLTRQQVIDNTDLLIIAGTETSSNTLTNAMQLLGMHPHVWHKMVEEQRQLVSRYGSTLTKEQIDKECPYLEAVIKEVMRLIPVSGGGVRSVDDTLVINGFQVPKGWLAWYSISLTHEQDPITFHEDGSHMDLVKGFQPERWLDERTRPTSEYMPFGAGNRFCLGWALAMLEMKIFLAVLARRIQFQLVNDPQKMKWKEGIILTPKDGCEILAQSAAVL